MPGMPVVACVTDIISAFQGSADAMSKIQTLNAESKPAENRILESELKRSLEKGRDELMRYKDILATECGYDIPPREPFVSHFVQLNSVKSQIESTRIVLDMLLTHKVPLEDPRTRQDDAITLRSSAISAIQELRRHMQARVESQPVPPSASSPHPPIPYTQVSSPTQSQHHPPSAFQAYLPPSHTSSSVQPPQAAPRLPSPPASPPRQNPIPSGNNTYSPPPPHISQSSPHSSRESSDNSHAVERWRQNHTYPHVSTSNGVPLRAPTWASEEASSSLTDQLQNMSMGSASRLEFDRSLAVGPLQIQSSRPPPSPNTHRNSVATTRSASSSTSNELPAPRTQSRRAGSIFGRWASRRNTEFQEGTIENVVGEVRSSPSAGNDWHGFCQGTFDISENPQKGLELVQRPWQVHSTKLYLQCKRCAFPGNHCGKKTKPIIPDTTVIVSEQGIRYRWMFLAKSHVRSPASKGGLINVQEHTARGAYRCNFCYLEGLLPCRLGGAETLMNHIWQHHRGKGTSDYVLRRTRCIIGYSADSWEDFDINIPTYDDSMGAQRGGDSRVGLATTGLDIADGKGGSGTVPGVLVGVTELSELSGMGRRGSPTELP